MYSLLWFCVLATTWASLALHERRGGIPIYALWVVASAAGFLTHYFFVFSVLASLVWLQFDRRTRTIARRATVAIICGGAVAAVWAPITLRQYHQDRFSWIGPFRLRYVWAVPLRLFTYAFNDTSVGSLLSTVAVGGVLIGVIKLSRDSPEGRLVAALAVLPVAFAAVV